MIQRDTTDASPSRSQSAAEIAALRAALSDWLTFAEEELSEFDVELCTAERLCHKCQSSGCIYWKIQNTRKALGVEP